MRKIAVMLMGMLLVLGLMSNAMATVLTFDEIDTGPIQNGYGGLNWNNMYANNNSSGGYGLGRVSGLQVAFNANAAPALVTSGIAFDFNGAYLTGAWNDGLNVTVEGWAGSSLLYSRTVVVSAYVPTWFQFDFMDVDSLLFSSFGGTYVHPGGEGQHFAMDNFTFNEVSQVPVPAAVWLLGSGLVGLVGLRKKFQG